MNISLKAVFVIIKGNNFCSSTANNTKVRGSAPKMHRLKICTLLLVAFEKYLTNVNSYFTNPLSKFTSIVKC